MGPLRRGNRKVVSKNVGRFGDLMERSLRYYKIPVLTFEAGESGRLSTIIANSGLPAPMLAEGRSLRALLDRIMLRATQGEDLLGVANDLIKGNQYLPDRYRKSEFFPKLCCDLIKAVWALKQQAQWDGGSLDAIWQIQGWQRELPFTVPEASARAIVTSLLGAAEDAKRSGPLGIDRILRKSGGQWELSACMSLPEGGYRIEESTQKIRPPSLQRGRAPRRRGMPPPARRRGYICAGAATASLESDARAADCGFIIGVRSRPSVTNNWRRTALILSC